MATGCIPAGTGGNHGQLSMRNSWAPCASPDKCSWDSRAVTEKGQGPGGEEGEVHTLGGGPLPRGSRGAPTCTCSISGLAAPAQACFLGHSLAADLPPAGESEAWLRGLCVGPGGS